MSTERTLSRSEYLYWAKTMKPARFNLATSGIAGLPLNELPLRVDGWELSPPGGYGFAPLQQRLAAKYGISPDRVVAATGASMANYLAMAALVESGDEVLIEQPAYEPLVAVARYLGAEIRRFSRSLENGFDPVPSEIERAISARTRVIVLTNLHNPSGVELSATRLRQIGELARGVGARVLVDEAYFEMLFDPEARSAVHLGDEFIVTSSLTKAYGLSGLRSGWILADPVLAERMWRINDLFGVIPAHIAERLSVVAFDELSAIARRARAILGRNRPLLNTFLDCRADLEVVRPEHGTVVFPRLRSGNGQDFARLARDRYEVAIVPGEFFEMPKHFRIGIGGDTEELRNGLERLSEALDDYASTNSRR